MTENKWDIAKDKYPQEAELFEKWVNEYMGQTIDYAKLPYDIQKYLWLTYADELERILNESNRVN